MSLSARFEEFRDDVPVRDPADAPAPAFTASRPRHAGARHRRQQRDLRARRRDAAAAAAVPEPERLVMVWERTDADVPSRVSPVNLLDWNDAQPDVRERRPASSRRRRHGDGRRRRHGGKRVAPVGHRRVLRGPRRAADRRPDVRARPTKCSARQVAVVLSEAFWRTRFGGDPAVVGREVRLDGEPYTVVGVAPGTSSSLGRTSIWAFVRSSTPPARAATTSCRSSDALSPASRSRPPAPTWRRSPKDSRESSRRRTPAAA